jgi:S-adenosylhomocysteine hydrolase
VADGRWLYVLRRGTTVNLPAAMDTLHASDMSFAVQAMGALYNLENKGKLAPVCLQHPSRIDEEIAMKKLIA